MRIVHVITRMILGGAMENTLLTCEGQADRGHEVTLLSGPTYGPEGSLVERARAHATLRFETVDALHRSINPLRDRQALGQLRRRLADLRPGVVHTHSSKAGILGRWAAVQGCPQAVVIHTIHGQSFHAYQPAPIRWLYTHLERRAARRTDHIISVCDAMTEQAVAARVAPPEKFTTVYSGMEVDGFLHPSEPVGRVRQKYDLPEDATVVVKVARLFHLKGHDDVLRAFAQLVNHHPTAWLLLVGDGVLRDHLERLARKLGITSRVRFAGLVPSDEVPSLIHASDLLVHASYREGLARVLPQALLCGRPVVSYDVDGAPEVVHPGETGLLVAPGDWHGLARAVDTLLSDRALRQRMGERGRELCRTQFDHHRMIDEIEKVYLAAIQKRGAAE
ncbi:MAG: glycosyltransferase family 4 protein [Planctomycetes bacterium]|nr:glycosyltransferase family 4 protein [Planctomycetota bacterium]